MAVDPYRDWLGIARRERPLSYYELLGLIGPATDPSQVEAAYAQRMLAVRRYQMGAHMELAQRLISELSEAYVCLTDEKRKQAYDLTLRPASGDLSPGTGEEPVSSGVDRRNALPPVVEPAEVHDNPIPQSPLFGVLVPIVQPPPDNSVQPVTQRFVRPLPTTVLRVPRAASRRRSLPLVWISAGAAVLTAFTWLLWPPASPERPGSAAGHAPLAISNDGSETSLSEGTLRNANESAPAGVDESRMPLLDANEPVAQVQDNAVGPLSNSETKPPDVAANVPPTSPPAGNGNAVPLAWFDFDGNTDNKGRQPAHWELKNTTIYDNTLYLNGVYHLPNPAGYVAVCRTPTINYDTFTVALRFRSEDISGQKRNLFTGGTGYRWFGLSRSRQGRLEVTFNNRDLQQELQAAFPVETWSTVACSVDIPQRIVLTCVNGAEVETTALPDDFRLHVVDSPAHDRDKNWSFSNNSNATVFQGQIGELRIYDVALSAEQLPQLWPRRRTMSPAR